MPSSRSFRLRLVALCALGLLVLSACGQKTNVLDQPSIGGERFTKITFEDLPRPAGATQLSYAKEGREQTETLDLPDMSGTEVMAFFTNNLTGQDWEITQEQVTTRDGEVITFGRQGRTIALVVVDGDADATPPTNTKVTLAYNGVKRP